MSRNRLMRTDELHKFSDGTLNHVRTTLNDIATGLRMDYLPKRRWSKNDKQRARVMMNAIDRKLRDRRLMRSLEKFVGGRPKWVNTYAVGNTKVLSDIEDSHGPSDAMHNPPKPLKVSQQTLVSFLTEITLISIDFLTPS
ncbi:hypothetical protein Tco_0908111 [Tanacetum coccineum]|uniref:Uncharacterized protein n=1 Tax=Tanacetum coccineum TaxID=301880 RepID=A0ABQ5CL70_9ASTR